MFINLLDIEKLNLVIQPKIRKWRGDARFNAFNKYTVAGKNDSKKDESKDKAVKTAEVAEEASKNTGTFNFILHSKTPQICWLQYSTDHGKAVLNNKENGYHLLAQPDRMNVQTINLSDP